MARLNILKSILYDGSDWHALPPPTNAQFAEDWEVEFDLELTRPWPSDFCSFLSIGSLDGLLTSYFNIDATLPGPTVTWVPLGLYFVSDDETWIWDESGFDIPLSGTTQHHLKLVKSGNVFTWTWTDHLDVDHITQIDITGYSFDISSEPVATLGCARSEYWNFDDDPWFHIPNLGKIKNFTSTFWKFERALKNASNEAAEVGDPIYKIINTGSLTGDILQTTSGYQPTVDELHSIELLQLNSKISEKMSLNSKIATKISLNSKL